MSQEPFLTTEPPPGWSDQLAGKVVDIRSAGQFADGANTAELRTAASLLLERMQFMRQAGMTFKGLRDLYEILGYARSLVPRDFRERYSRGGLAGRIVDVYPNATWRGGFEIVEDEDPKVSTELEKAWVLIEQRLNVSSTFRRVDKLAGQGRFAVLLLGDGQDLSEPLKKYGSPNPEKLLYLTPFAEEEALIQEWDNDIKSPRFGLPKTYMLRRGVSTSSAVPLMGMPPFNTEAFNKPVDFTRIIHVAEDCLENDVFGPPRLERVWNLLDDLDKVTGGGAEAFWLRANQGLQLDVDKDMQLSEAEKANLREQAEEYQHQIRRMMRTRGVTANTLGSDVANFSNPADAILTQIAGALAIPKRILTGSEMGELASSQDRDNWKDQVNGRQTAHAGPYIVRPFVVRLIEHGYLPPTRTGKLDEFIVKWSQIQVLTEQEKSEGANKWALTATPEGAVFTRDEIRDKWYGMEPLPKPDLDKETGVHTAPDSGLEVEVKVDPETGLALKPPAPEPVQAVDPETGRPMVGDDGEPVIVDPKSKLPIVQDKKKFPRAASEHEVDEALLEVLAAAIRENNTEVIDHIVGLKHD